MSTCKKHYVSTARVWCSFFNFPAALILYNLQWIWIDFLAFSLSALALNTFQADHRLWPDRRWLHWQAISKHEIDGRMGARWGFTIENSSFLLWWSLDGEHDTPASCCSLWLTGEGLERLVGLSSGMHSVCCVWYSYWSSNYISHRHLQTVKGTRNGWCQVTARDWSYFCTVTLMQSGWWQLGERWDHWSLLLTPPSLHAVIFGLLT